jgi:alkanesulfonate monooxygenase SsuD/methylene tetrahydromethanopterin reductase-like flavin-dependent oxidoreductase (luciferase family)
MQDLDRRPLFSANPFRLGLFAANADGGFALTTAPERWRARWDDYAALVAFADKAGFEFNLPLARWKGFQGEADVFGWSFETLTQAAALTGVTANIHLFATVHVPLVHPVFAAKALATIDQASHGRAGLNIVCGWNQEEFDMFGAKTVGDSRRYAQGLEWYQVLVRLFAGGPPFDQNGEFYQGVRLQSLPGPVQQPRPVTISAGFSENSRDFAAQTSDAIFTRIEDINRSESLVRDIQAHAARHGRHLEVFTSFHVVCRPTRKEAEDFYRYFADEKADHEALVFHTEQKVRKAAVSGGGVPTNAAKPKPGTGTVYPGSYPGAHHVVGSPDDVAEEIIRFYRCGITGAAITFLHYLDELPFFIQEVVPRLEVAGLRRRVHAI